MSLVSIPALRLTIYVGEQDTWHHRPLYAEIVHRAHRAGLAGASVFHGIEGYGGSAQIHTTRLLSLADYLPVAVVIIDKPDRIESFLSQLHELIQESLVTMEQVRVVHPPNSQHSLWYSAESPEQSN